MPRYAFGPFTLDTEARTLLRDSEQVAIAGKTFDTLTLLVQNRGRLVEKDELLSKVWSGTVVEESNLSQAIFTVRKILGDSPKDPRYIATVAGRGYQFVAPVTEVTAEAPLDSFIVGNLSKSRKKAAIGSVAVVAALLAPTWFLLHRAPERGADFTQKRLTFNSSENPVESAAISPDGKYLAYSDPAGIHVKLLSTADERLIPRPAVGPAGAYWFVDSWFPDGTQLLADIREPGGRKSMWTVSLLGQSLRQLREDAAAFDVSPDGTHIAFGRSGTLDYVREMWVMGFQGDNPQKILTVGEHEWLQSVHWSPDGQRLAYIRVHFISDVEYFSIETCDLKGAKRTAVVQDTNVPLADFRWLPDGRIIYASDNLWQIGIDNHRGTPAGKPKRITRWAESNLGGLSTSADGKRLVMLRETNRSQISLGTLATGGTRMSPPRRLTNDEADDEPMSWTPDSKAVLFMSDRNGPMGIYKQGISQETPEPVFTGPHEAEVTTRLSADGAWILFAETKTAPPRIDTEFRIMRVPTNGGPSRFVLETRNMFNFACARAPATLCVIFGLDEKQFTVTAFDPLTGSGKMLRTMEDPTDPTYGSALSPDGSTAAISRLGEAEIHIRLLSLSGGSDLEIAVHGWPNLTNLDWAADGKGFYCGSQSPQASTLLYVDLKGNARVLWQYKGGGGYIWGIPSPDGRYLALGGAVRNSNAWMLEGF